MKISDNVSRVDTHLAAHHVGKISGLPDSLKDGIENLSGFSMDGVRVYYNSLKPVALSALTYTMSAEVHLAPGQEKQLPHEAWHVVQQKGGRVSRTYPQPTQGQIAQQAVVAELAGDPPLTPAPDAVGEKAVQS